MKEECRDILNLTLLFIRPEATQNCSPHDANLQQIWPHICLSPVARCGVTVRARAKANSRPFYWP